MELTYYKNTIIPIDDNVVTKYKKSLCDLLKESPTIEHNNYKIIAITEESLDKFEHAHKHYCLCRDLSKQTGKKEYTKKILSKTEISEYIEKNFDRVLTYWIVLFGKGSKAKELLQNMSELYKRAKGELWYTVCGGIIRYIGDKCINKNEIHYHVCIMEYPNNTRLNVLIDNHTIRQYINDHKIKISEKEYRTYAMNHNMSSKKSCILL